MSAAISIYELRTPKDVHLDELGRNYLERSLLQVLFHLDRCYCWLPGTAPIKVRPLEQITLWPRQDELEQLHSIVIDLFMTEHRNRPNPYWKAYRWVNKLFPKLRLVQRTDKLVQRARNRLKEAGESRLMELKRKVHSGAPEAERLLKHLRALDKDGSAAAKKIAWEDYEQLLFEGANHKPVQLVCDDLSASPRMRCYGRALEIIVDDLRYERMYPLLRWIGYIGYPDFPKPLGDTYSVILSEHSGMMADLRKKQRTWLRVAKHRLRKRTPDEIKNWIKTHSEDLQFAGRTEAEFLRKISH
jgi:hypothetical protein